MQFSLALSTVLCLFSVSALPTGQQAITHVKSNGHTYVIGAVGVAAGSLAGTQLSKPKIAVPVLGVLGGAFGAAGGQWLDQRKMANAQQEEHQMNDLGEQRPNGQPEQQPIQQAEQQEDDAEMVLTEGMRTQLQWAIVHDRLQKLRAAVRANVASSMHGGRAVYPVAESYDLWTDAAKQIYSDPEFCVAQESEERICNGPATYFLEHHERIYGAGQRGGVYRRDYKEEVKADARRQMAADRAQRRMEGGDAAVPIVQVPATPVAPAPLDPRPFVSALIENTLRETAQTVAGETAQEAAQRKWNVWKAARSAFREDMRFHERHVTDEEEETEELLHTENAFRFYRVFDLHRREAASAGINVDL